MTNSSATEHGGKLLKSTPENLVVFTLYVVISGFVAVFPVASHTRHYVFYCLAYVTLILIPVGFVLFRVESPLLRRVLSHPVFWLVCLALLGWYDQSRFINGILHQPNGNTASTALTLPARNLLSGKDPYLVELAGQAPVSPGPGWILLLAPISLAQGAGLLTFFGALIVSVLLASHARVSVGIFLILTLLQIDVVWTSFWGTDLFLIPLAFAALCLLADRYHDRISVMIVLGCAAGILAQSRVPMAILPLVLGLGLWRKDRRTAKYFILSALVVAIAFYLFFYLWTVIDGIYFQPLHLLYRERRMGLWSSVPGPLAGLLVLGWIWFRLGGHLRGWLIASGTLLLVLSAPTGLAELANAHDPAIWEGANYVSFGLSLFVVYLAHAARQSDQDAEERLGFQDRTKRGSRIIA